MKKIQVTLLVEESKELIARATVEHPLVKKALKDNKIILKGGTTTSRISEKLINQPLRICGRITDRGTVTSFKDTEEPHNVLIEKGKFKNIDSCFAESIKSLGNEDVIISSANIIDSYGNAAIMAGSEGGGSVGLSLGAWYTEGAKILIPAGIEKLVPGNINEIIKNTSRKNKEFSYGMSVGLFPLIGEIINEIKALEILTKATSHPIGAGGLNNAQGSITLEINGNDNQINKTIEIIKDIKNHYTSFLGTDNSKNDCRFPSDRCGYHVGCAYKSKQIKEKPLKRLGLITIGQSPRKDITKDIFDILRDDIFIYQSGALDNYSKEEIESEFAPKETTLVTKLRDGTQVKIDEKYIENLIQNSIDELEKEKCEVIALYCTGKFKDLKSKSILIKPHEILHDIVKNLSLNNLGLIIPDENQIKQIKKWWEKSNINTTIVVASPYKDKKQIEIESEKLMSKDIDAIFMDCMGYTLEMKSMVEEKTGKKVILPRTLIARIINDII